MTHERKQSWFIAGVVICVFGAVCFSTKAIFVKLAYRDTTVDPVTLLALRMLFSLPFFLVSAVVSSSQKGNVRFTFTQWVYIAFIGCLGYYVSSLLDFLGLQYVSAGMERLILFIYPTLVLLMSAVLFREKVKGYQWLAVAVTYAGLLIAFFGEVKFYSTYDKEFYLGAVMIFECAITYAIYIVGSGRIIPVVGAAKFNSYAMTFACIAVVIHFLSIGKQSIINLEPSVYLYSVVMALVSTVVPSYLVTEGIKRIGSDNAAIVGSVGPVSTIIQAAIFLQEPVFTLQIIGTLFVLGGVLLIGRKKK
jgi:drug/metabolite transporter (DMT)-like permease